MQQAGLPPGVLNVISGFGPTAGGALSNHMDVDKVFYRYSCFTSKSSWTYREENVHRIACLHDFPIDISSFNLLWILWWCMSKLPRNYNICFFCWKVMVLSTWVLVRMYMKWLLCTFRITTIIFFVVLHTRYGLNQVSLNQIFQRENG